MKISVCMIVWNEADLLPAAINSVAGLADEIVILDTGSTDNTLEVARDCGCQVFEGGDRMDKAAARNRTLEEARGDWIVILDADEKIADPLGFREYLARTNAEGVFVQSTYMNGDIPTLAFARLLAWRRGLFKYKYRAHEVPLPAGGKWPPIEYTDFVWEHRPPKARTWKLQYVLDKLLMDLEEHPGDPRVLFYLARQYTYMGAWEKALETFEQYLKTPTEEIADACTFMATCYLNLGRRGEYKKSLYMALAHEPARREHWGAVAQYLFDLRYYRAALAYLKGALEIPPPHATYIDKKWYGAHIYDLTARCYWQLGEYEKGAEYARRAADLGNGDPRLMINRDFFEEKLRVQ